VYVGQSGALVFDHLCAKPTQVTCTLAPVETPPEGVETPPAVETEAVEPRGVRLRRHGHRAVLYTWAFAGVGLIVVIVALAVANAHQVRVGWVFGSGHESLVWIVVASGVLGWLLGIVTAIIFRLRTRRRPAA
jgi:uncharacterized integral membrane protein